MTSILRVSAPSLDRRGTANRLNAGYSTGPKTPEGKARVAKNRIDHGIHSLSPVIQGLESSQQWAAFRNAMQASLAPANAVEACLASRITLLAWRLRRVTRYETEQATHGRRYAFDDAPRERLLPDERTLDKILRYESHLARQFHRDLHELQRLQATRQGQLSPAPLAVDMDLAASP